MVAPEQPPPRRCPKDGASPVVVIAVSITMLYMVSPV
jgi:hypothetical protein